MKKSIMTSPIRLIGRPMVMTKTTNSTAITKRFGKENLFIIAQDFKSILKRCIPPYDFRKFVITDILVVLVLTLSSCEENQDDEVIADTIYVADENDHAISVIDVSENMKVATIHLNNDSILYMPHNVQVAPDGKTIWVTGMPMGDADEQVIVIDPETYEIISRIDLGTEQHPAHVVLDNQSDFAYVTATESNQVIKIDATTFQEVTRFNLGVDHEPHGMRYHNGKLYVANIAAKSISIIDLATSVIEEIPLGGIAVQTAVLPNGSFAYVSLYDTKEVARIDLQTKALTKISLPTGAKGPIQLYPTPDSELLYVCDQGGLGSDPTSNKVYVIDIAANTVDATITAGNRTHGVVVNNIGTKAFVTNTGDNTVSVIDIASKTVTGTIGVGSAPNGIAFRHAKGSTSMGMP